MNTVSVVVCVDSGAMTGLHVTLRSAIANLSREAQLDIHAVHHNVSTDDFNLLRRTLDTVGRAYTLSPVLFDPISFRHLPWQGGWMTYARLLVPDIVDVERLIYLDADLIIRADLRELYQQDLNGFALGAASWSSVAESNDREFFRRLDLDLTAPYFNAGVLLINTVAWRRHDLTKEARHLGETHRRNLSSMDQTILNLLFYRAFHQLPRRFNTPVTASRPALGADDLHNRIIHLVARPKPWDPLGFLNGQSKWFREELSRTVINGRKQESLTSWATLRRCLRLTPAYAKCARARLVGDYR